MTSVISGGVGSLGAWWRWESSQASKFMTLKSGFWFHQRAAYCCFKGEIVGFEGFEHGQTQYLYGLKNLRPRQDRRTQIWNAAGHARMWQSGSVHRLRGSDMSHCFAEFCRHKSVSKCGKTSFGNSACPENRWQVIHSPLFPWSQFSRRQDDELSYALGKQGGTRKKLERSSGAGSLVAVDGGLSVGLPKNASIYGNGSAEKGWSPTGIWGAAGSVSIHQKVGGQRQRRLPKETERMKARQKASKGRNWKQSGPGRSQTSRGSDLQVCKTLKDYATPIGQQVLTLQVKYFFL